jgi:hypothetical protein
MQDINYLNQYHVSPNVISYMQNCTPAPAVVYTRPRYYYDAPPPAVIVTPAPPPPPVAIGVGVRIP